MNKCFFLDRDGVLIKDRRNITKTKDIFFFPGIFSGLHEIRKRNFLIIIITNQSVIGRGLLSNNEFVNFTNFFNKKLFEKLGYYPINDLFFCPHHPIKAKGKFKTKCKCRKPGNEMFEKAINKWNINRKNSVMIGDKFSDYIAAKKSKIKFYYKENSNFRDQVRKIINEKIS